MERAVTIVTNNLSIATVSIPVILLGPSLPSSSLPTELSYISVISIILFAVLFAPSSLIQRVLINTGLVQTAKEARHEGDDEVKSEGDVNVVSDLGDLEDTEVRYKTLFQSSPGRLDNRSV